MLFCIEYKTVSGVSFHHTSVQNEWRQGVGYTYSGVDNTKTFNEAIDAATSYARDALNATDVYCILSSIEATTNSIRIYLRFFND